MDNQHVAREALAPIYVLELGQFGRLQVSEDEARNLYNNLAGAFATPPAEPAQPERVALTDEHVAALRGLVNETRITPQESTAVWNALEALDIGTSAKKEQV